MHPYAHNREVVTRAHVLDDAQSELDRPIGRSRVQHQGVPDRLDLPRLVVLEQLAHGATEFRDDIRGLVIAHRLRQGGEPGQVGEEEGAIHAIDPNVVRRSSRSSRGR